MIQQPTTPPGRFPHKPPPHTPHERAQQAATPSLRTPLIPVAQFGSPTTGDGVRLGVVDGSGMPGPKMTQGAGPLLQGFPSLRILFMQHSESPPGAFAHIIPPQVPHLLEQHTADLGLMARMPKKHLGSGPTNGVGVGDTLSPGRLKTQGGPCTRQELLTLMILGIQQPSLPPGRLPHIIPPQRPHDLEQHTLTPLRTPRNPREQVGSGGFTNGDGSGEGGGEGGDTMQGGGATLQDTPDDLIAGLQHSFAPPGGRAHMFPPHRPQRLVQQTVMPLMTPEIPVRQSGSAGEIREGIGDLVPVGSGVLGGGGVRSGITQGAGTTLQSRPEARIIDTQQLLPRPPVLHSGPPQTGQDERQHAFPRRLPDVQVEVSRLSGSNGWELAKARTARKTNKAKILNMA